jgi:hypothetical protein
MKLRFLRCIAVVLFFFLSAPGAVRSALAAQAPPAKASAATPPKAPAKAVPAVTPTPLPEQIDSATAYQLWAEKYFRVFKIPKKDAILLGKDRIRMHRVLPTVYQLVGEEGDYYLARNLPLEDKESPMHKAWLAGEYNEILGHMRAEYMKDKYLIVDKPAVPPPFTDVLRFTSEERGLPRGERWQMSFDIADMNGDGLPDLVLPPPRLGEPEVPHILLQQKDGSWQEWRDARWPQGIKLDYGAVRVADFDGDGHLDIAIACHFLPTYVLYGDGRGDFTRVETLPALAKKVTSRSLTVADFNGDGRPDLATLAELNINIGTAQRLTSGLVDVMLNLPDGWKAEGGDFPNDIQGDDLTSGDLNGDGRPDLVLTSTSQGVRQLVFLNEKNGTEWRNIADPDVPYNAFVYSAAIGHLVSPKQNDLILCYEQVNPKQDELPSQACTIYRFHDAAGKFMEKPQMSLLFKREVHYDNILAVAVGDIDGDGRDDIALAALKTGVRVFLQLQDGEFYEEKSGKELDIGGAYPSDIRIADLNGDGRGEVIVMGTIGDGPGGVWIFSPHPLAAAARP